MRQHVRQQQDLLGVPCRASSHDSGIGGPFRGAQLPPSPRISIEGDSHASRVERFEKVADVIAIELTEPAEVLFDAVGDACKKDAARS
jgi:hypothetical protein